MGIYNWFGDERFVRQNVMQSRFHHPQEVHGLINKARTAINAGDVRGWTLLSSLDPRIKYPLNLLSYT